MHEYRKAAVRYGIAAFFLTAFLGCGPNPAEFTRAKLQQAIQTNPQRIDLAEYVSGTWDRVCFFGPHTPAEIIASVLGFAWPEALDTGIEKSKDHTLLVFVNGQRVAQHVMFERTRGDFRTLAPPYCYPRAKAVFRVSTPDRVYYRELAPLKP